MPARNPEAVRQRTIDAARQRSGQLATPTLDPAFMALNPDALPARERPAAELYQWVRRDEDYAILGASVVVELNSESRARKPTSRAWAIIPPRRPQPTVGRPTQQPDRAPPGRPHQPPRADPTDPREREMVADAR